MAWLGCKSRQWKWISGVWQWINELLNRQTDKYKTDTYFQCQNYQNYSSIIQQKQNPIPQPSPKPPKMSHLISTDDKIEPKCLLSIPCKQVITPKYRQMLRKSISSTTKLAEKECLKEEAIMKKLCDKLAEKELRKLQVENQRNLKKQFQRIKKRLQNQAVIREGAESQVLKYFQGRDQGQNLSSLLKIHQQNIEIGIKYQSKIVNKLLSIKQSSEIEQNKSRYRSWLNSCNNSPLTSPNFNKMNYVIEKVSKNKEASDIFMSQTKLTNLNEKEKMRATQLARMGDKHGVSDKILVKQVCGDYSPKSRVSIFHKNAN